MGRPRLVVTSLTIASFCFMTYEVGKQTFAQPHDPVDQQGVVVSVGSSTSSSSSGIIYVQNLTVGPDYVGLPPEMPRLTLKST